MDSVNVFSTTSPLRSLKGVTTANFWIFLFVQFHIKRLHMYRWIDLPETAQHYPNTIPRSLRETPKTTRMRSKNTPPRPFSSRSPNTISKPFETSARPSPRTSQPTSLSIHICISTSTSIVLSISISILISISVSICVRFRTSMSTSISISNLEPKASQH